MIACSCLLNSSAHGKVRRLNRAKITDLSAFANLHESKSSGKNLKFLSLSNFKKGRTRCTRVNGLLSIVSLFVLFSSGL